jgi:hypothetical protein
LNHENTLFLWRGFRAKDNHNGKEVKTTGNISADMGSVRLEERNSKILSLIYAITHCRQSALWVVLNYVNFTDAQ